MHIQEEEEEEEENVYIIPVIWSAHPRGPWMEDAAQDTDGRGMTRPVLDGSPCPTTIHQSRRSRAPCVHS